MDVREHRHEHAAGPEQPGHVAERDIGLLDVLERVDADDPIEALGREVHVLDPHQVALVEAEVAGEALFVEVDSDEMGGAGDHHARLEPAADIEHLALGLTREEPVGDRLGPVVDRPRHGVDVPVRFLGTLREEVLLLRHAHDVAPPRMPALGCPRCPRKSGKFYRNCRGFLTVSRRSAVRYWY